MKNIAILVGVDKYDSQTDLPSCKNDVLLMSELLMNMGTFKEADILIINNNEESKEVKDKILKKITSYKESKTSINQLFFYFSGHGMFYENEFYYILKNFDFRKIKQSSLENLELDTWIRDLNPKTTVKVVDACQSGKPYIKNTKQSEFRIEQTPKSINDCYFFSSSKIDQSSYADCLYSDFTYSFVEAILSSEDGEIRYKEIADYISDYFATNTKQKPYFITQSDYREVFGKVSKDLKDKINKLLESFNENSTLDNKSTNNQSLIDEVIANASKYCTKDEILDVFNKLNEILIKYKIEDEEFSKLYDVMISTKNRNEIPHTIDLRPIGRWIADNDDNYFAKPKYTKQSYTEIQQVERNSPAEINQLFKNPLARFSKYQEKEVTKYKNVISGFELTENVGYDFIQVNYNPKYPNLERLCSYMFFIFSKKSIVLFIIDARLKEYRWGQYSLELNGEYNVSEIDIKNEDLILEYIIRYINEKAKNIKSDISKKLKKTDETNKKTN